MVIFKPKSKFLVKFGGPWNGKFCYILRQFFGHLI
jgi:hypothetical protein